MNFFKFLENNTRNSEIPLVSKDTPNSKSPAKKSRNQQFTNTNSNSNHFGNRNNNNQHFSGNNSLDNSGNNQQFSGNNRLDNSGNNLENYGNIQKGNMVQVKYMKDSTLNTYKGYIGEVKEYKRGNNYAMIFLHPLYSYKLVKMPLEHLKKLE